MIIGFYERTRLKRAPWQALSLVLLVALLCAFFAFFEGFLQQKERDIDTAYDVIPVTLVLSNITGTQTDHLEIFDYEIDYFLSEKYSVRAVLQPRAFSTYVKDVRLKASMYYNAGSGSSYASAAYYANGSGLTRSSGVNNYNGRRETYYSSNVLYHYRTGEWTQDSEGFWRDSDGYYVVAAGDKAQGSTFTGSKGECKVYDSGCAAGTTDYYTGW